MSDLPIITIILLALEVQSIREKPLQEFYNIFQRLFEITNTIDTIIRKTEETETDYTYELKLYRNELTRLANEISNRYM